MSAPSLSVGQAVSFGWRRTWSNFWRLLLVVIVFAVINGIASVLGFAGEFPTLDTSDPAAIDPTTFLTVQNGVIGIVSVVIQFLVSIFLTLGIIRIAVAVTAGADVSVAQVFATRGFGRFLGGSIIVGIVLAVGFLVPFGIGAAISASTDQIAWVVIGVVIGLIIAIVINLGFSLFGYLIVDQDARGLSSLGQSWALVRPHFLALLGLHILLGIIGIGLFIAALLLGILMIVIGLLITLPLAGVIIFGLYALSIGSAYRQLSGQPTL